VTSGHDGGEHPDDPDEGPAEGLCVVVGSFGALFALAGLAFLTGLAAGGSTPAAAGMVLVGLVALASAARGLA